MNINPQIPSAVAFLIIVIIVLFAIFLMEMYYLTAIRDIDKIVELMESI